MSCQLIPVAKCCHDRYSVPVLREVERGLPVPILQCDVCLGTSEEKLDHVEGSLGARNHERVVALDKRVVIAR